MHAKNNCNLLRENVQSEEEAIRFALSILPLVFTFLVVLEQVNESATHVLVSEFGGSLAGNHLAARALRTSSHGNPGDCVLHGTGTNLHTIG